MGQIARKNLITSGWILLAVVLCGWVGYSNRLVKGDPASTDYAIAYPTPTAVNLAGCPQPAALCLESYGLDSAQNMFFVLTNSASPISEIYITLQQEGQPVAAFPCKWEQAESESFYCMGGPVFVGTTVSLRVINKSNEQVLANADIGLLSGVGLVIPATSEPVLNQDTPTPSTIMLFETTPDLATPFSTARVVFPTP